MEQNLDIKIPSITYSPSFITENIIQPEPDVKIYNDIVRLNVHANMIARDRNPLILLYFTGQDRIVRLNRMVSVWFSVKEAMYLQGLICWRFVKTVLKL